MPAADAPSPAGRSTRATPRVLLIVAAALLVARVATGIWERHHPPPTVDRVAWQPIAGAEARAAAEGKPVLYFFTAEWCPPCHQLKGDVFADERSAQAIEKMFVPVMVLDRMREEGRNAPEVAALQATYRIESFPTLIVVPPGGGPAKKLEGYAGRMKTMTDLVQAHALARARPPRAPGSDSLRGP